MTKNLLTDFDYDLQRIPKEENNRADTLAKLASAKVAINNKTIIQEMLQISCTKKAISIEEGEL